MKLTQFPLFYLATAISIALASACTTNTFQEVTSSGGTAPSSITGHSLTGHSNNLLYVYGGTDNSFTSSPTVYGDLSAFNLTSQTWSTLSSGTGPGARSNHGAVISTYNSTPKLLIVNGLYQTSGTRILKKDLWSWNIQSGTWTQLMAPPINGHSAGFVYHDGYAYRFGGFFSTFGVPVALSNALYRYDVAGNTWTTLTANGATGSPPKRQSPNMVVIDGNIYVHGGARFLAGAGTLIPVAQNDTWMFNITSGTWSDITPSSGNNMLPSADAPAFAASGSSLVIYGGDTGYGVNGLTGCSAPYPQQVSDDIWIGTVSGSSVTYSVQSPSGTPPALTQGAGTTIGSCFYSFGGMGFPSCPPGQVYDNKVYTYGL